MIRFAFLIALAACARPAPSTMFKVVTFPETPKATCYIEDFPKPPEPVELNLEDEDVQRRVFIHMRTYNEMVQYASDVAMWAESVRTCLDEITNPP